MGTCLYSRHEHLWFGIMMIHTLSIDVTLFCGNKKPASLQVLRILCASKIFLCQWIVCFLEFEGALDDAS